MLTNQYTGVNPHLNGLLQTEAGPRWKEFHDYLITRMATVFNRTLIPKGFEAVLQESVQIQTPPRRPESDVAVFDRRPEAPPPTIAPITASGARIIPTLEAIDYHDTAPYNAVTIRHPAHEHLLIWIEVLSPTNKPKGRHAAAYLQKRQDLLSDLPLIYIELDLLHHSPPIVAGLPAYPTEPDSAPYALIIHDVRASLGDSQTYLLPFTVQQPIPSPTIPLSPELKWPIPFQQAYDEAYEEGFFGMRPTTPIDYTQPPADLGTYSPADQTRITNRMKAIQAQS